MQGGGTSHGEGEVKVQPRAGHCLTSIFSIQIRKNHTLHVSSSLFSLPFLASFVLLLLLFMFHDASNVRNLLIFLDRFVISLVIHICPHSFLVLISVRSQLIS